MPFKLINKPVNASTLIALAASLASICAVAVAAYQTYLSRQQQLNSVWPYLLTNENIDETGKISLIILNQGIGPAIIDSAEVFYHGQKYATPIEVIRKISKKYKKDEYAMPWSYTGIHKGYVIPQGETILWLQLNTPEDNVLFRKELPYMKTIIYYHSIYNQHWKTSFHGEPTEEIVENID